MYENMLSYLAAENKNHLFRQFLFLYKKYGKIWIFTPPRNKNRY